MKGFPSWLSQYPISVCLATRESPAMSSARPKLQPASGISAVCAFCYGPLRCCDIRAPLWRLCVESSGPRATWLVGPHGHGENRPVHGASAWGKCRSTERDTERKRERDSFFLWDYICWAWKMPEAFSKWSTCQLFAGFRWVYIDWQAWMVQHLPLSSPTIQYQRGKGKVLIPLVEQGYNNLQHGTAASWWSKQAPAPPSVSLNVWFPLLSFLIKS